MITSLFSFVPMPQPTPEFKRKRSINDIKIKKEYDLNYIDNYLD